MWIDVGGRLYFDVDGAGLVPDGLDMVARPVVVALHGGPGADHSLFKPALDAVTDFAQVVYLDQRGSGRSDRGGPEQWSWRPWADDVIAFCDALGIESPVLLGTSSGGWVALTAAITHPDRVGRLVLDSVMPGETEERLQILERLGGPRARDVADRYWRGEPGDDVREAWTTVCLPLYSQHPARSSSDPMQRIAWNPDVLEHFRTTAAAEFDPWPSLCEVTAPTLVLAGRHDPVATVTAAERLVDGLTGTHRELQVFEDAGHGVFRETPRAAEALRGFLERTA